MMRAGLAAVLIVVAVAACGSTQPVRSVTGIHLYVSTCFDCPPPQTPMNFVVTVLASYSDGTEGNTGVSGACGSYEFIGPGFADVYAGCSDRTGAFARPLKRIGYPWQLRVSMTYQGVSAFYSDSGSN